ncbi:MAG: hypothetical protein HC814_04695 [Rhodobacteraceae bacterium]|nr:hypothetical protein [Paracoccaceae bacterium]
MQLDRAREPIGEKEPQRFAGAAEEAAVVDASRRAAKRAQELGGRAEGKARKAKKK